MENYSPQYPVDRVTVTAGPGDEEKGMGMRVDQERKHPPAATEMACSWCDEVVPMPDGDYSGVCISCGTVMFRGMPGGLDRDLVESAGSAVARERVAMPAVRV